MVPRLSRANPLMMNLPGLAPAHIIVPGVVAMLAFLQFQTLPLGIRVQTLPVSTVIALVLMPFVMRTVTKTPLLSAVILFFGFVLLHSVVALVIDLLQPASEVRMIAWIRQLLGLVSGVITYLVLRQGLIYIPLRDVFKWITIGFIPPLILSLLNIGWGAFGVAWAGSIVENVRDIVAPEGYTSAYRATGFTNEPAAWATSIVLTIVPALLFFLEASHRRLMVYLLLLLTIVVFAWTFSTIGLLLILAVLASGIILGPRRGLMGVALFLSIGGVIGAIMILPSNQITRHLGVFLAGKTNISFNDRFFGLVGPFMNFFESWVPVGYGLGGISTHFRELIPVAYQQEMLSARWAGLPNITILVGRVLAETGALGIALFSAMLFYTFRELHTLRKAVSSSFEKRTFDIVRLGWFAVCASLLISIGPYQTPFLWFYMALVDASYIRTRASEMQPAAQRPDSVAAAS